MLGPGTLEVQCQYFFSLHFSCGFSFWTMEPKLSLNQEEGKAKGIREKWEGIQAKTNKLRRVTS